MALLEDSLIAHYRLNDDLATDVIIDETGNHNGTIRDPTGTATSAFHSVSGKINLAIDFDGVDDDIFVADHDDFSPVLTPFSISAWLYMHDATNFWIATKGPGAVNGEWAFSSFSDDKLLFYVWDSSENTYRARKYNTTLTSYENQWIHVVATYDGGILSSGIKLYLNDSRVDDTTDEAGSFVSVENLGHVVLIGRRSAELANGFMDNMMFFNKELTQLDIDLLYNSGAGVENIPIGIHLSRSGQQFSSSPVN